MTITQSQKGEAQSGGEAGRGQPKEMKSTNKEKESRSESVNKTNQLQKGEAEVV